MAAGGRRFDVVVVDPPSFASRRVERAGRPAAVRPADDARRSRSLEPGGTLVQASCSSRVSADDFVDTVDRGGPRRRSAT